MARTRELDIYEIRVLGALLEKELQTPDHYPLTINATIAACNQKTNRNPVTAYSETEVVEALDRMRKDVITWREVGPRSEKWKHSVDRKWELDRARKAIMSVLLLRGPQTPGELKIRSERSHRFASKEAVQETLESMSQGIDALVENMGRLSGQREERWQHLVGRAEDRERPPASAPLTTPSPSRGSSKILGLEEQVAVLDKRVASLEKELHALRTRLGDLEPD